MSKKQLISAENVRVSFGEQDVISGNLKRNGM